MTKHMIIAICSFIVIATVISERETREREKKEDIERFRDSYIGI